MELLIALLGAAVVLAALVLVAGYRGRGRSRQDVASADPAWRDPFPRDAHGSPSSNAWTFSGGASLP